MNFYRTQNLIFILTLSLLFVAPAGASELADKILSSVACKNYKDLLWNSLYEEIETSSLDKLKESAANLELRSGDHNLNLLTESFLKVVLEESVAVLNVKNKTELLEVLTSLELGDKSTAAKASLQRKIVPLLRQLKNRAERLGLECTNEGEEKILRKNRNVKNFIPSPTAGVNKAFSTFYQSCQVLNLNPMTAADPNVEGITITGTHSDGVGKKRIVSSATKVASTNPYMKNIASYEASCVNVKNNPPIYDYGGKPYASSDLNSELNFFKNAGSGTSAMGIDCSGLVFANLASVGLKLKSDTALKAISVNGISSTMLSNPSANGLDCLERVTFTETNTLAVGDIISKPGHTVSVFSVGADPFGVASITKISDCTSSKLSSSRFDFTISQSSPIKGGIGVNRIKMSEYLKLTSSWSTGLMFYAIKACKAKFGAYSSAASSDKLAIVRHKGTSECIAQPIALTNQSCVSSCGM